jgi:SAM-dependent methyltransferase
MPNGLALAIILLVAMLFLAYIISLILNFFSPFYTTPRESIKKIVDMFKLKPTNKFVDLGSGDGRMLFETYKQYKCKAVGYEISPIPLIYFKIWKLFTHPFNSKIQVKEESFFHIDLSQYDVIYCCLPKDILEILEKKFKKELKEGTKVYTYKEGLGDINGKEETIDNTKVYQYTF